MTGTEKTLSTDADGTGVDRTLVLRLYVVRGAQNSNRALANLMAILQEHFPDRYALEVVDILQDPKRAIADGILVTPTLVKLSPEPGTCIAGDLSQTVRVLQALIHS